ncbi:MAG: CBS domain-containing protein [Candidatus Aenigmarchaeota archaeon]|nr:CBS domain-containing protein [Candidatus Aenigmarchaeota archaeon]
MLVKDVMNPSVAIIDGSATAQEAAKMMGDGDMGSLIVVKGDLLLGIITERDILRKVVAVSRDPKKAKVTEIMTKDVIMIGPDDDIEDAVEIMLAKRIKRLPVVKGSALIGIVTATDICAAEPKMIKQLTELMLLPQAKKVMAG